MSAHRFATLAACITGLCLGLWLGVAAPFGDDFMYARMVPDTCEADFWDARGRPIASFADAASSLGPHWRHVNSRGANLLMLMLVPLPRWCQALLLGLAAAAWLRLAFAAAARIAGHPVPPWLAGVACAAVWLWFPWADELVAMDCFVNYVVPSLVLVGYGVCLAALLQEDSAPRRLVACGAALFAGVMHEGFALPAATASLLLMCLLGGKERRRVFPAVAILTLAAAVCALAPSTLARLGRHEAELSVGIRSLLTLRALYAALAVGAAMLLLRRTPVWRTTQGYAMLFWAVVAVASLGMGVLLGGRGRVFWPACVSLGIVTLASACMVAGGRRPLMAVAWLALLADAAYGAALVGVQARYAVVQRSIIATLDADPLARVSVDINPETPLERLLRGMPRRYTGDCRASMMLATGRYGMEWGCVPYFTSTAWGPGGFDTWPLITPGGVLRGSGTLVYSRRRFEPGERLKGGITIVSRCHVAPEGPDTLWRYDILRGK